jgi:hypothetical protein
MSRRKGELTPAGVDRGWPHQVAILGDLCTGKKGEAQADFCKDLSMCVRGHRVVWQDEWYNVRCFAIREHAQAFMQAFGGEWFDPREKGRGDEWHLWRKGSAGGRR